MSLGSNPHSVAQEMEHTNDCHDRKSICVLGFMLWTRHCVWETHESCSSFNSMLSKKKLPCSAKENAFLLEALFYRMGGGRLTRKKSVHVPVI